MKKMKKMRCVKKILTVLIALCLSFPVLAADEAEAAGKASAGRVPTGGRTATGGDTAVAPKATGTGDAKVTAVKTAGDAVKTESKGEAKGEETDGDATTGEGGEGGEGEEGAEGEKKQAPFDFTMILIMGCAGFLIMSMFSGRGRKKQEKKRQEMIDSMKKGDRVVSIGGIYGTVVEVKSDVVVVKIGENTRVRFAHRAIHQAGDDVDVEAQDEMAASK